jgi:hypothetical protein
MHKLNKNLRGRIGPYIAGILSLLVVSGILLVAPLTALAHADRLVNGKYGFRVGFLDEPAYSSLPNGIDLAICLGACKVLQDSSGDYANPITDTEAYQTLKVEVIFGGSKLPLSLTPVFRKPGKFSATFIPMAVGDYTFHFFGTIGTDKIDEKFNSAKDGFDAVQDIAGIQFPSKLGAGTSLGNPAITETAATTSTSVATATETNITTTVVQTTTATAATTTTATASSNNVSDTSTLQGQLATANQELQQARQEAAETRNSAEAATNFALIGIGVAIIAILVAIVAIVRHPVKEDNIEAG